MIWSLSKPLLIILLFTIDFLLLGQILQNKKPEVLGTKSETRKVIQETFDLKKPPVLSFSLAEERYPSKITSASAKTTLAPSLTPTPTSIQPSQTDQDKPESNASSSNTSVGISTSSQASVQIKSSSNSLLDQINSFRSSKGMSSLSENSETCGFAESRAGEIVTNFNHDGFRNRIDSKTLPYPSYSSIAENIAMNPDANQVVPGWINSPGHAENLLKDVPYGCVRSNGNYFVFEAWRP